MSNLNDFTDDEQLLLILVCHQEALIKKQDLALERARTRPVPSERRSDGFRHRVDHFKPGMQPLSEASTARMRCGWVIGDHSAETFKPLWELVRKWQCYFYVTRMRSRSVPRFARSGALAPRWKVYPGFIPDGDRESLILPQRSCGANIVRYLQNVYDQSRG